MFKGIFLSTLLTAIILSMPSVSEADALIFCDHPYGIFYSPVTEKVYLACAGDFDSLDLITIDPFTLDEVSNFRVGGLVQSVLPFGDGDKLLILLSEMDDDPLSHDGALRKIDAQTGELIPGYEIAFDESPLAMVVDNAQNYAYVSVGLDPMKPSSIIKIDLTSFAIMSPVAQVDKLPDVMVLSNDDRELYIKSTKIHKDLEAQIEQYFNIVTVNTDEMTLGEPISIINIMPFNMEIGYDNRLYASFPCPMEEFNADISLVVIDTDNNQVIETVSLDGAGIWMMKIDELNQKLYGLIWNRDVYDPDLDATFHGPSPIVVQFDLNDPTYTSAYYELENEGLWAFVVVPGSAYSRLFAIARAPSPYVYYMDIAH